MKVIRPSKNNQTTGYSSTHKGYDFAGLNLPDEVLAGKAGVVLERVDLYDKNWQAFTANDPFKTTRAGKLLTQDYGNYIKVKHDDGSFELHAHLKKGSALALNTRVQAGQTVARIGNTGNSTGPHLHSEYRTSANINTEAEFITNSQSSMTDTVTISGNEFRSLKQNASIKVEVYKKLDIVNPDIASLDDFTRVWSGHKSTVTTLQNQLAEAQTEVKNRIEQVRRKEAELLESEKLRAELTEKLSLALQEGGGMIGVYEKRLKELQNEIDTKSREVGLLKIDLAKCQANSPVADLSIADVLILLFNKLKGVKLK